MKKKRFAKFREWNRRRNYFMKDLRINLARLVLDYRRSAIFDLGAIRRILLLRDDDKIGDMVVSTLLFREFHRAGYVVDVLAGEKNYCIIEHNPYVNHAYIAPVDRNLKLVMARQMAKQHYDLIVDMGDKMSLFHLRFLKAVNARNVVGFNKGRFNIYNKSIDFCGYEEHVTTRYSMLLKSLEIKDFSLDYDIYISEDVKAMVKGYVNSLRGANMVVINPYSSGVRRDLSLAQIELLVSGIKSISKDAIIIFIGVPDRISKLNIEGTNINPFGSIASAVEIVRLADVVVSPDTSIVHICAAFKIPLVCLYGHDMHGKFVNRKVWGPGYSKAMQVLTKDKDHPVSTIAVEEILQAIRSCLS